MWAPHQLEDFRRKCRKRDKVFTASTHFKLLSKNVQRQLYTFTGIVSMLIWEKGIPPQEEVARTLWCFFWNRCAILVSHSLVFCHLALPQKLGALYSCPPRATILDLSSNLPSQNSQNVLKIFSAHSLFISNYNWWSYLAVSIYFVLQQSFLCCRSAQICGQLNFFFKQFA